MPTTLREIQGNLRFRLSTELKLRYPDTYGERGFLQTTEVYFIKALYGLDPQTRLGDYYINPGDGGGPIVVEIGTTEASKWEDLLSTDGIPVRVLRFDMEGRHNLFHPRHTQFEGDLMTMLTPA